MKALVLSAAGGLVHSVELDFTTDFEKIQQLVGGDIEVVTVLWNDKPATLCVNEEGAPRHLQPNARATALYWTATIKGITGVPFSPLTDPLIYGNAVLFPVDKRRL